jgi:hypothetical protein
VSGPTQSHFGICLDQASRTLAHAWINPVALKTEAVLSSKMVEQRKHTTLLGNPQDKPSPADWYLFGNTTLILSTKYEYNSEMLAKSESYILPTQYKNVHTI